MRTKLPLCVGLLLRLLKKNHRVYITCTTGFDRSPACVIAYLHWMTDTSLHVAYNYVTGLHSCKPDRFFHWLLYPCISHLVDLLEITSAFPLSRYSSICKIWLEISLSERRWLASVHHSVCSWRVVHSSCVCVCVFLTLADWYLHSHMVLSSIVLGKHAELSAIQPLVKQNKPEILDTLVSLC